MISETAAAGRAPGTSPSGPAWLLEREARALLTRLDRVKPFVLQETMVPAASLMPVSQVSIERYLMDGRRKLRDRVQEFIRWIRGPGATASPVEIQRRYVVLRLSFNTVLTQLDLFAEALSQRSEHETGVWLSGLDVAAQDALTLPRRYYEAPAIICHLHRGFGGAIRRARTRLPGGGESPVAVIRIPRERMIGFGIASSLVHEVGHQGAALLGLVESLRPALQVIQRSAGPADAAAWGLWTRWISEIVADLWAIAKVGITSTLGLLGIVSLPRRFVFRVDLEDPHPFPWIRMKLSCAIGNALYPHRQWDALASLWDRLYPVAGLDPARAGVVISLERTMPHFIAALLGHKPRSLQGKPLQEVLVHPDRTPDRLLAIFETWRTFPAWMRDAPPTLVFAVFGRARASDRLTPEAENQMLGDLLTHWAMRSTLDIAAVCAGRWGPRPTGRGPGPQRAVSSASS